MRNSEQLTTNNQTNFKHEEFNTKKENKEREAEVRRLSVEEKSDELGTNSLKKIIIINKNKEINRRNQNKNKNQQNEVINNNSTIWRDELN